MSTTTIKLDTRTRDALREASEDGETYDALLLRLLRSARQQRMAEELATWVPTADEHRFLEAMAYDAGRRDVSG